jgi:predicted nucleic-acid-binding protein
MIAIDTNVLLRQLLDDDDAQSPKAHTLIEKEAAVLITDVVLAETVWTLKGKKYHASKDDIIAVVNSLLAEPSIVFENRQVIWAALNDFRTAKPVKVGGKPKTADFADALIVRKARAVADPTGEPLAAFYTFDRAALALIDAREP